MGVVENLIELRKKSGVTIEEAAEKLGVTRQTYSRIEKNEAPLTTKQLDVLSGFFGVPIEEFFYGIQNHDKFKQMYLYILGQFKEGVPKTKLAKLLYLTDFTHFYRNLESMSGALYYCKEYGPLADPFLELTDDMFEAGEIKIECLSMGAQMISIPKRAGKIEFGLLSKEEKKEISEICEKWHDANTQTIVNFTHHQKPWMACRRDEVIPYELILQEEPDHVN